MMRWVYILLALCLSTLRVAAQEDVHSAPVSLEDLLISRGLEKSNDPERYQEWLSSVLHLYDPYGEIFTEDQMASNRLDLEGEASGFGWVLASTGSWFRVEEDDSGIIPPGSVLKQIGGLPVTNRSFSALQTLIQGLADDDVEVVVDTASGDEDAFVLKPGIQRLPTFALKEDLPEQLGYLRVYGLFDGAEKEVLKVLRAWTETDCYGLILDLRQASGTNLDAVEKIASLLVPEGEFLFAYRTLDDQDIDVRSAVAGGPIHQPVMVLIDPETRGASEVLAATLSGIGRGVMILGQPSAGDPLIRELIPFGENYQVYITDRKLVTADGKEYLGKQTIQPHVVVHTKDGTAPFEPEPGTRKTTLEEEAEDLYIRNRVRYDPVMRRAVDVLLGLKALRIRTEHENEAP